MSIFIRTRSYLKALDNCKEHPIIKLIKAKNNSQVFNFSQINMKKSKNLSKVLTRKKIRTKG